MSETVSMFFLPSYVDSQLQTYFFVFLRWFCVKLTIKVI